LLYRYDLGRLNRIAVIRIQAKPKPSSSSNHRQQYAPRYGCVQNIIFEVLFGKFCSDRQLFKPLAADWMEEKTGKCKGVKKHLRGLVDASARNDDTAPGCMQFCFQLQRNIRFSQIMLFFTTAAHFTWLLHVHLHISTSIPLKKFKH
jgi:hypothetical protein